MDRLIEVKVYGHHLTKDNKNAGVQHEANATVLRITFDEGWDEFAKTVTFWDALGSNPVSVTLTANLLEDITISTRVYMVPIPGEAMTQAGKCSFVIDGYVSGTRQRSLGDELVVHPAPYEDNADEPADPTPTQAEQLQVQIDTIMDNIAEAVASASQAAQNAQTASAAADRAEVALDQVNLAFKLVDDTTGEVYRLGADNGELYLAEAEEDDPANLLMEGIENGYY